MSLDTHAAVPMQLTGSVTDRPTWARPTDVVEETFLNAPRISLLHGFTAGDVYRNGQNSWSPTGWRRLDEPPLRVENPVRRQTADDTGWDDPQRHHSSWMMVVTDSSRSLLLGCLEGDTPRLHADRDLLAAWTETNRSASWVLITGHHEHEVMGRYRDLLADRYGVLAQNPGKVWSSWYSFYEGISRADLDRIVPELPAFGIDTVQLDDGWEKLVGDWQPNDKFAAGMRDTASSIIDRGMRPGLWIAPFIALPSAEIVERNPQMVLRGADGSPVIAGSNWGSGYYTFDFTRSDAQDFLVETIGRAVQDWGFTYLKLDFINAGAVEGVRSADLDRETAYRSAMELIREAAGPHTYILGSGAPIFPSLGVVNAVRTGPDVAPMWDNYASDDPSDAMARNAVFNGVNRLWMRDLIGLDPDVVYFRRQRNLLNAEQMQWLQDCATLSDFRAVSDPPEWLDEEERRSMRQFFSAEPETEQIDRYRFRIGSRLVDFEPAINGVPGQYAM
ncbi:glycoside hydrolase family 36 protein [Microbacterium sp. SA39]|uniref:glycoside hydrolase family 36 protein n=1 Tax=Microbacterium sp. SA39 TaxID=1263625 RepID=UPI0005F9ECDC|nr:glycoside hydrolase family 36 protein [Microbacterium sp. SA39]KJQ54426.1 Melibiase [Microbacterium sp. SA39]